MARAAAAAVLSRGWSVNFIHSSSRRANDNRFDFNTLINTATAIALAQYVLSFVKKLYKVTKIYKVYPHIFTKLFAGLEKS